MPKWGYGKVHSLNRISGVGLLLCNDELTNTTLANGVGVDVIDDLSRDTSGLFLTSCPRDLSE